VIGREGTPARRKTVGLLAEIINVTAIILSHIINVSSPKRKRSWKENGDSHGLSAMLFAEQ
jgi:hypothetical protein